MRDVRLAPEHESSTKKKIEGGTQDTKSRKNKWWPDPESNQA